jgi:hypothetical protein
MGEHQPGGLVLFHNQEAGSPSCQLFPPFPAEDPTTVAPVTNENKKTDDICETLFNTGFYRVRCHFSPYLSRLPMDNSCKSP